MKYTDAQIKMLLGNYFREVASINWERFTDEEYKVLIEECSFKVIENFVSIKNESPQDMLFYISSKIENYHLFLIKENRLIEVHQTHGFRWCLTCDDMGEKSPYIDREA